MFFGAAGPQWTESFFVVWTRGYFGGWIDVQVKAFIPIRAISISNEEVTFWHLPQIKLV